MEITGLYTRLMNGEIVSVNERGNLGLTDIELVLDRLTEENNILLHGTRTLIEAGSILQLNEGGTAYATSRGGIAILKAIFSNTHGKLIYPWQYSKSNPLSLIIENGQEGVENEVGYVYLLRKDSTFYNMPQMSWQWLTHNPNITFCGGIEVQRSDFRYLVEYR
jgi:hypothetical protein